MGAIFNSKEFRSKDEIQLRKDYTNHLIYLEEYYGLSPYNGTFTTCDGLVITNMIFDNIDDAENWLEDNTDKWGNVKAVKANDIWIVGGWCAE